MKDIILKNISRASLPEVNAKNPIYPDFTKVTTKKVVAFFS